MDSEKLITLVYEHRCLWDMKDKNYHNRDLSRKKWEEISKTMDVNGKYIHNLLFIYM